MARQRLRLRKRHFYARHPSPDFGLRNGQLRGRRERAVKNAGWYDRRGMKLGWGDLSMADMRRIAQSLRRGELFVLLSERDSFWAHVTEFRGSVGGQCVTAPTETAPGRDYVATRCTHVISPRRIHIVERWDERPETRTMDGVTCAVIGQDGVDALFGRKAATTP